jgi:hypothetical protein
MEHPAMNSKTEKVISTGLTLAREAGAAAVEASSKVGTNLVKVAGPQAKRLATRVKDAVSIGAAIAAAKKGGQVAVKAARKNPVATAAAAVALAGVGVAVVMARKRKVAKHAAAAGNGRAAPKKLTAKNMRGDGAAKKAPAKRAAPASRARKPAGATTKH